MIDRIRQIESRIAQIEARLDQVLGADEASNSPFAKELSKALRTNQGGSGAAVPKELLVGLAERKATEYGLDPALVKAVISAESDWNVFARSRAGALGLMQLMPKTAGALGVARDIFNPERNIDAGARYLAQKLSEFNDVELALAAYNAGSAAVKRYGNAIPPFAETQGYVRRVMELYRQNSLSR